MRLDDMHWRQERIVSIIQTMDRKISKKMDVKKKKEKSKGPAYGGVSDGGVQLHTSVLTNLIGSSIFFSFYYNMDNTDQESCTQYVG